MALLLPAPGDSSDANAAAQKQHRQGVADALEAVRAALRPRCQVREPRLLPLMRELLRWVLGGGQWALCRHSRLAVQSALPHSCDCLFALD
jgi:hypothetical protein